MQLLESISREFDGKVRTLMRKADADNCPVSGRSLVVRGQLGEAYGMPIFAGSTGDETRPVVKLVCVQEVVYE